jgi:flagellar motility protein MotE (MotC chaperone)
LVDELDQAEDMAESQSGGESPPGVEEPETGEEASEPENLAAQKAEELAVASARINELEQVIVGKDGEIASLQQTRDELEERLTVLGNSLAEAVAEYKSMVVQANPEIVEELISGDTIESINDSLEKAKVLVNKVRQGIETEVSLAKVPAGAPERTPPDLSALSAREKIQYAIGGKR